MVALQHPVVGRDAELAAIDAFLARGDGRARTLVLEGEARIGKTTLWRAGVESAERLGYRHSPVMPVHYDLHAWVYEPNSSGTFAPFNPGVDC